MPGRYIVDKELSSHVSRAFDALYRNDMEFADGDTFKMLDQWQEGELIRFEKNENGEITRIIVPGYSPNRKK